MFLKKYSYQKTLSYPNVYDSMRAADNTVTMVGTNKVVLSAKTERKNEKDYEEFHIPAISNEENLPGDKRVKIASLDAIGRKIFHPYVALNRIQSLVFDRAYNNNDNLLICAPTGAGKTNIALLTIIRAIRQNLSERNVLAHAKTFKIVYIAPMKALAAEMTANFSKKLAKCGLIVRELTGDMQLTRQEIENTHMLVTTPEKWDVVTRKSNHGETALSKLVKLLIIDEIHLLHDERGPVIESIVARTLRQVEITQTAVRIVGLSATLPNYIDVAEFLRVDLKKGLFFFDGRFRPIPLNQTFVGVKAKTRLMQENQMDDICYEKLFDAIDRGHQCMIFVHSRNKTFTTAETMIKIAKDRGDRDVFLCNNTTDRNYQETLKKVNNSRNKPLNELFQSGFGMHHAGMIRAHRSLVERAFAEGHIKVLCCTATLAWGINLPARCVIIKGTSIYNAEKSTFMDLGVLDVKQIFGRAGRPQFDSLGEATIITTHDKLGHYLRTMTRSAPIESQFREKMIDNLNAEIAINSVSNVQEAIQWLRYTYFYIRLFKNPIVYGCDFSLLAQDPTLTNFRRDIIIAAAKELDKARMIRYNNRTEDLVSTDLGRTACNYYITHGTILQINERLKEFMTEFDVVDLTCSADEFKQIRLREEETEEIANLSSEYCDFKMSKFKKTKAFKKMDEEVQTEVTDGYAGVNDDAGNDDRSKVGVLFQAYISRAKVESYSLISDLNYISANVGRILRAFFEITLKKGWPQAAKKVLEYSIASERRIWPSDHPLWQLVPYTDLNEKIMEKVQRIDLSVWKILDFEKGEIGAFIRDRSMANALMKAARSLPKCSLNCAVKPITYTVLKVVITITPNWIWNDKVSGLSEPFWIWIEDDKNHHIYQYELIHISKKQCRNHEESKLVFTIPIISPKPDRFVINMVSEKWLGIDEQLDVPFSHIALPEMIKPHTNLLDLNPLPISSLNYPEFEKLYPFDYFNPIQTQVFHTLYHTDKNALIGAPTGSGKTIIAELAILRMFLKSKTAKCVYIAPLKALVRERIKDWKKKFNGICTVVELTGEVAPDMQAVQRSQLIVCTPEKWDGISRSWRNRKYVQQVELIVIDEIHMLGEERGPVLEVVVSRANYISQQLDNKVGATRIVGLSTALANADDLAAWLEVGPSGFFNFRPSVRPVPMDIYIQGFSERHYCPRMATMNKPALQKIREHSPDKPVLIFVASRRQTRITGMELISLLHQTDNPKQWVGDNFSEQEIEDCQNCIKDKALRDMIPFGIGMHHAGLNENDRDLTEKLFLEGKIRVLTATATLAWGVNLPAHLVIIKGTEFFDGKLKKYVDFPITDVLQMVGRAGRPQFDTSAVAHIFVQETKKEYYKKFLYEPFPVESCLLDVLPNHLNAEISGGSVNDIQEAIDYLTWTYFIRRVMKNPAYYGLEQPEPNEVNKFLTEIIDNTVQKLVKNYCLQVEKIDLNDPSETRSSDALNVTPFGQITSYYYLNYETMGHFLRELGANDSVIDILQILSDAPEFSELPVRHNEDNYNEIFVKLLPINPASNDWLSSNVKTHLLFQAHLSNAKMPCSDYITDLKSALDNALRLLQAMLDICVVNNYLKTSISIVRLMQGITMAHWPNISFSHSFISQKINQTMINSNKDKPTFVQIDENLDQRKDPKFKFFNCTPFAKIVEDWNSGDMSKIYRFLNGDQKTADFLSKIPQYSVTLYDKKNRESVKLCSYQEPLNDKSTWNKIKAVEQAEIDNDDDDNDEEENDSNKNYDYNLQLTLKKLNKESQNRIHAAAPKFVKPKLEGWIVILYERNSGDLISLKRINSIRKDRAIETLSIDISEMERGKRYIYTLLVMSDSYLDIDQMYDFRFEMV